MKRNVVRVTHVANRLTDPHPTFVSLVEHGANQTPFLVVKTENIMTPETHKFVFKKEQFSDEAAVKTYLEKKGFAEPVIEATETEFTAVFKEAGLFSETSEVVCEDGVVQIVGKLKDEPAAEQKAEEPARKRAPITTPAPETPAVQPVAKSLVFKAPEGADQETVKRFDSWCAYYEGQTTLAEAIAAGITSDRGAPVGFASMMNTAEAVIKNNFAAGTAENIPAVCAELGAALLKLHGLWAVAKAEKSEEAQKIARSLFATEENPSATPAPEPSQKGEGDPPATPEPQKPAQKSMEEVVQEAVDKAVSASKAESDKTIAELQTSLKTVQEKLDGATPARKSADNTEVPPAGDKTPTNPPEASTKTLKGWDSGAGV